MAARFCANCGTEVDDTAVFCPTCGQPIEAGSDRAPAAEIPAAPAWPEPEPRDAAAQGSPPEPTAGPRPDEGWAGAAQVAEEPTRVEERPPPAAGERYTTPPPATEDGVGDAGPPVNLPITTPVTLSAWLIGIGAILAALGVIIGLFDGFVNPIELLLLLALIAIAATVFFSANLPEIPNLRLGTLAVLLIGFGMALDRIAFTGAGAGELLLFLGTAAAAMGAILLELGQDQPLGGAGG